MASKRDPTRDITVTPWPASQAVRIDIAKGKPPAASRAAQALWREMLAANPRLYDGDVLAVDSVDVKNARIKCHRDSYKRFVTAKTTGESVVALGVTGVILHDGAVLMGKRAANVRAYPGLWETAPRGGIGAPTWRTTHLTEALIKQALRRESSEELGELGMALPVRLACIVRDPVASSLDLCYLCIWRKGGKRGQTTRSWEYDEVRWMPRRSLLRRKNLSPPTRALWLAAKALVF